MWCAAILSLHWVGRAMVLGLNPPTPSPTAEFPGPTGPTRPSPFRPHYRSPEFPDPIPSHFQRMNRLLLDLSPQGGLCHHWSEPKVWQRGTEGIDREWVWEWTQCSSPGETYRGKKRKHAQGLGILQLHTSCEPWEVQEFKILSLPGHCVEISLSR